MASIKKGFDFEFDLALFLIQAFIDFKEAQVSYKGDKILLSLRNTVQFPKQSGGKTVKCSNEASALYIHKGAFKVEQPLLNGHKMTCKKN